MEEKRPYGADALFTFPLLDGGATEDFEDTPVTIAAGDVKVWTDKQVEANPTAETVAFTSGGTTEPTLGETLTGATSGETCVLMFYIVTSGTWAGGDAAGELFVKSASGAFQSENLNGSTSGSNVMTIGGDLDGAGLFQHIGQGMYCLALTAAEMSCKQGWITIRDQTATEEWADTAMHFKTTGHESAWDPEGCILTDTTDTATGQTTTNLVFSDTFANLGVTPRAGNYVETYDATNGYQETYVVSVTGDDMTVFPALQIGALPVGATIRVYRDARKPVDVRTIAGTSQTGADVGGLVATVGAAGVGLTEAGGDGDHLTEAGGDGDHLTALTGDVGAIKTKTDQLNFGVANQVDANVESINTAGVTGDGNATPWDGA